MKKGILRMLGVVVSLAMLLMALPSSLALAAAFAVNIINTEGTAGTNENYELSAGSPGDSVKIWGTGINGTEIDIYFSSQNASVDDEIGDEVDIYKFLYNVTISGGMSGDAYTVTTLEVPSKLNDDKNLHGGTYYVYIVNHADSLKNILARATFQIVGVSKMTSFSPSSGPVGTVVTMEGEGYAPGEYIKVNYYHTSTSYVNLTSFINGSDLVQTDGKFSLSFAVPESINGVHTVKVVGEDSQAIVEKTFTVIPSVTLSASSGKAGDSVIVYAKGFARSSDVDISIGTIKLDNDTSTAITDKPDTFGSLPYIITIPTTLNAGTYDIVVRDEVTSTINAKASFTIILESAITITSSSGNVGDKTTVNGTKFTPASPVTILFDSTTVGTATVDASGNFTKEITIPASAGGAHKIKVGSLEATYTVVQEMALDKTQGIAGTTITITGTGFAATTAITAKFNNTAVSISPATTDANGGFVSSFVVPSTAAGPYTVEIIAGSTPSSASFTIVESSISVTPTTGINGTQVTVTGVNFAAGSAITITIDGVAVTTIPATITAASNGGFTASFSVQNKAGGIHTIVVTNGATSKSAEFTVTATASATPLIGNVGTSVTVNGSGFKANAPLTIKYNNAIVGSGSFGTTGSFPDFSFAVPASAGGARTIEVSDGTSTVTLTFTMETTAPAVPSLILPLAASQEKGNITFDWSDVTDLSLPVTYTLQVATDSNFTNLVLNIAGLTASTYTMPEGQTLTKLDNNASYYWKVKATDAASNSSSSATSTFTVGTNLPDWLMWVWIGVGALVIFIFAIWLGKRLAFSRY